MAGSSTCLSDEVRGNCRADPSLGAWVDHLVATGQVEGVLVVAAEIHAGDLRAPRLLRRVLPFRIGPYFQQRQATAGNALHAAYPAHVRVNLFAVDSESRFDRWAVSRKQSIVVYLSGQRRQAKCARNREPGD